MTVEDILANGCNESAEANCTLTEPTISPPSYPDYTAWLRFSITSQFVLIFAIFFINAAVVLLVARFKRLRVLDNSFVVSLAAADWLLSLAMMPGVGITLHPAQAANKYACLLLWCSIMFASSASVFSLLALSLDRYLKIVYPLHQYMTQPRACAIIAFVWSYTFVTAFLLPFAGLNNIPSGGPFICFNFKEVFNITHLQMYCYANGLAPFLLMFVMYGKIFAVVLEKLRANTDHQPSSESGSAGDGGQNTLMQRYRQEFRIIKRLSILLGTTTISWVPITCMLLRQIYDPTYQPTFETRVILSSLTYMNSAVNPLLYALRMQSFREALASVFCRRFQGQNVVYPTST